MISFKKKTLLSVAVAVMLGSAQLPGTSWAAQAPAAVVQEVSAEAQAPAVVKNPPKLALKIDRADVNQLPRNFRMGSDKYVGVTKTGIMPTRKGMDTMNASASSCFSEKELEAILKKVPVKPSQFYDVDLRGESHGYLNGTAVSWFANHDWGNDGRTEKSSLLRSRTARSNRFIALTIKRMCFCPRFMSTTTKFAPRKRWSSSMVPITSA